MTVTGLTAAVPGLTVRPVEAGAQLQLTNHSGRIIDVLGYAGEPYLQVRPDGGYENVNSPTTYRNRTIAGDTPPPADAAPDRPADWRRISTEPVVRWHDQRAYWLGPTPPEVRADPTTEHRIRDWVVPLRDGDTAIDVQGTLDWVPPPDPWLWWAGILLGAVTVGGLGILPGRYAPTATRILAGLGILAGAATVAYAVGREVDAGAISAGAVLPILIGLGALAAGGYALTRRRNVDFVLALAGVCLTLFAGLSNAAVLARAIAPVPGPAVLARLAIAVAVAAGAGIAAAALLRLRTAARAATGVDGSDQPPAANWDEASAGSKP